MNRAGPTVRDALAAATEQLGERVDAELLLLDALGKSRSWLFAHGDDPMPKDAGTAFDLAVARRLRGVPIAYITGRQGFWSFDLEVTSDTLIPRPETELLVEAALACVPLDAPWRIVDLGTGSGAIALALARERPHASVVAVDTSEAALTVARRNAQSHGVHVRFVHGYWLDPVAGERFDLIVSNPPYIQADDPHLEALSHEPSSALVAGLDGLDDIRLIVQGSAVALHPGGWLLLEHGWNQGQAVRALFGDDWQAVETLRDLEGRERVTRARYRHR
ncbi:peptide chain release factor N(5)-glutamine methyltransferase [Pinirhizobacter sp.]|jgi:release factor glutamine methyltransferase|uniref:peptide chain release factor N(5)-glutamine methyltransferase n=1 Tax=Pinirhizobacter sp. TaxID=2950432 RepID=UPI002F3EB705